MFSNSGATGVLVRCQGIFLLIVLVLIAIKQVLAGDLSDNTLVISGELSQGGLLVGKVLPSQKIFLKGEQLYTAGDGTYIVGLGRKADKQLELTVVSADGRVSQHSFSVAQRSYSLQEVNGVPQRTVTPDQNDLVRIRRDAAMVKQSRREISSRVDFLSGFIRPVNGPITGVYGSQRVFNGVPGSPHYGIDYAAPTGTSVIAPAGGKVVFAHPDLFYSGGTLIIDHGFGLSSTFLHLSELLVEIGDEVSLGDSVAKVGATGRATGPHLDWRMNWRDVRIDPQLVLKALPRR